MAIYRISNTSMGLALGRSYGVARVGEARLGFLAYKELVCFTDRQSYNIGTISSHVVAAFDGVLLTSSHNKIIPNRRLLPYSRLYFTAY